MDESHLRDHPLRFALPTTVVLLALAIPTSASDAQLEFFEKKIRPVLVEHCYECHSADAEEIQGSLLLDSREMIRKGGESGPGVIPERPDESLVLDAMRYESFEMPPSGRLDAQVIADFERWIAEGAHDPREATTSAETSVGIDIEAGKQFWSFRPLASADPPSVDNAAWPESDVDLFLQSRREQVGLAHAAEDADRTTMVRRIYYALIGLPPTPEQIEAFTKDTAPTTEAITKLVDRLLESKHFGERWGRHWLDVVRFAESSGGGRTLLFPDAWRYRDYVIEAFNDDMPYDQFLREQIAGDLMPAEDWQTRQRQLVATAFLLLGPTNYELQDKDILEMDIVDEQLDTLGKALMGMTIGCARCHDHKFDPIPMRDYYAMAGIFKSTKSVIHSNVSKWNTMKLPVEDSLEQELAAHEATLATAEKELKQAKSKLKKLEAQLKFDESSLLGIVVDDTDATKTGQWVDSTVVKPFVGAGYIHDDGKRDQVCEIEFAPELEAGRYEVRVAYTPGGNRSNRVAVKVHHANGIATTPINQTKRPKFGAFQSLGEYEFDSTLKAKQGLSISNVDAADGVVIADAAQFIPVGKTVKQKPEPEAKLAAAKDSAAEEMQAKVKDLEARIKKLKGEGPKRPVAMASVDEEKTEDIHLAIRGVVANKGPVVPRGVLQVALNRDFPAISEDTSGRLELANWVVDSTNPLTARVIVNRVWYWLFGEGLVRTVDNFGAMGEEPSHPELLDYLARSLMEDGWSIKRLVRRIMLSRTFRLSSDSKLAPDGSVEKDPANRMLWRMNRLRLDAESIRDSIMSVAGTLDTTIGGQNIKSGTKIEYGYVFDSSRRSVYLPVFRNTLPQIFANFDFADPNIQGGKRTTSTIAPQALLLMNQPFVIEQTKQAAERLLGTEDVDQSIRINRCYQQVLGRRPSEVEQGLASQFLLSGDATERWSMLYQALFQSLDFRYVE